jgi:hypothetical protein
MAETQKFMGRGMLVKRLTAQMGGNRDEAIAVLRKRGHMEKDSEKLTAAGRARDNMTAEERAKDRTSKKTGVPTSELRWDPRKNSATGRRGY